MASSWQVVQLRTAGGQVKGQASQAMKQHALGRAAAKHTEPERSTEVSQVCLQPGMHI